MRVLITNLSTHKTAVIATLGWVHTSRTLDGRLAARRTARGRHLPGHRQRPRPPQRQPPAKRAQLGARPPSPSRPRPSRSARPDPNPAPVDPRRSRRAHARRRPSPTAPSSPCQGPHNFGGPENRYGAPRAGHIHQGQDILTAEGTPDARAARRERSTSTSYQAGGAGYYLVEHTTIGFDLMFAHCEAGSFQVTADQAVTRRAEICKAGQTGDATAPTCTSRCGSAAGRPQAGTRSTRSPTWKPGNTRAVEGAREPVARS